MSAISSSVIHQHNHRPKLFYPTRGGLAAIGLALMVLVAGAVEARQGHLPYSRKHPVAGLETIDRMNLPATLVDKLLNEDATKPGVGPLRVALPVSVNINPTAHGTWETMTDGTRLWRMHFESVGATDLNFGFIRFQLPTGAALYVLSGSDDYYEGPYTAADHQDHGQLWVPTVPGSEAIIELYLPPDADTEKLDLVLSQVATGYRDLFGRQGPPNLQKQGSCNIDVVCSEGDPWLDEIRSVARILIGGSGLCTGTLINDQPGSFREFLLTAAHCGIDASNAATVVTYWKFEATSCGALSGGSLAINQTGATFRARRTDVDMTLIELNSEPPSAADVHYAGWDRSGAIPPGSIGIHHPSGDEKAITFNDDPLTIGDSCIGGPTANTHWFQVWEQGTTEPGSSGSGLWDTSNGKLVGFLSGGTASCSNTAGHDCYGQMSVAWDGASASSRLRDWLDPNSTNVSMVVDGADPSGPPPDTALAQAIDNPALTVTTDGNSNWFEQSNEVMVGNSAAQSGPITHSQSSHMQTSVAGPTDVSFFWKVNSEANFDFLRFSVNGTEQDAISGETTGWALYNLSLGSGSHTLSWTYNKDSSVNRGADAGWVDGLTVGSDSDGDGVPDDEDAFPNDPSETTDTDGDGVGNNADLDDDNDGVADAQDDFPLGRFSDAPPNYWAFRSIEALARAGITSGCGGDNYCPLDPVTRAQMAVFLERGMRGSNFSPPSATGNVFQDVGVSAFAASFIEQLFADGITSGCGNNNYCPNATVTRDQMAVFLLRAKHGASFTPPAATGMFTDVPLSYWAVDWIEQLAAEGITGGCGNGNYCPTAPVTRDQMAVFLVRTFGL